MKKIIALSLAIVLSIQLGFSQRKQSALQNASLGFNISNHQTEFGYGINFTSPYFSNIMAVRLTANLHYLQYIPKGGVSETWSPYGAFRLGLVSGGFMINQKIRIYGEGGVIGILPNSTFTSRGFSVGGYGLFGFEFHPSSFMGQFIEVGGGGTGAVANRAVGDPIYNNGFLISAGFRVYFKR